MLPHVVAEIPKLDALVPVIVIPEIVITDPPLLVRVVLFAADVDPLATGPKASEVGANVTPAAASPVPLNVTDCGDPGALSTTLIAALIVVAPPPVNVAEIEQLAPAASDAPQVFAVIAKLETFAPVSVTDVIVNVAFPEFVRIVLCAALVTPYATPVNVRLGGVNETFGLLVVPPMLLAHPTSAAKAAPIAKVPKAPYIR